MSNKLVNSDTGEVVASPYSKFMHQSVGLDVGSMIIQHNDFAWSDEIRDFIVVEGEKEDRQAYIDSFADECGVYNILKKYAITGDASLLNRREGFYGDISELPVGELNPGQLQQQANGALDALNKSLGTEYTADQLQGLTSEQIAGIINSLIASKSGTTEEKKEG